MSYPKFRRRVNGANTETRYFYIPEAGVVNMIAANNTEYFFAGPYTSQTESEVIDTTSVLSEETWAEGLSDYALYPVNARVGASPFIRAH